MGKERHEGGINKSVDGLAGGGNGELVSTQEPDEWFHNLAISPDGTLLATSADRGVCFWRIPNGDKLASLSIPNDMDHRWNHDSLAFSPDGKTLGTAYSTRSDVFREVVRYDKHRHTKYTTFDQHCVVVLYDTVSYREKTIVNSRDAMLDDGHGESGFHLRDYSPDSTTLVTSGGSGSDNVIATWNVIDGKKIAQWKAANVHIVKFGQMARQF